MSQIFQNITRTQALQQTGRNPNVQAGKPVLGTSAIVESREAGEVPPRVVILTALPEEFIAVAENVTDLKEIQHPNGTIYECGCFSVGNAVWDVAIVETGQGNSNAATETQRAIDFFKPNIVLFVGIAGGRKETKIGDVVAADKIYNYESGRDEIEFKPHPETVNASYNLEQRARAIVRTWMRRNAKQPREGFPNAFVRPIAAGESVVAATESMTNQRIEKIYGDALAIEKEGYGFLDAAQKVQSVSALVIRGISDLLDGKEASDRSGSQTLAARNASKFAFELLANLDGVSAPGRVNVKRFVGEPVQMVPNANLPDDIAVLRFQKYERSYALSAHHTLMPTFSETASEMDLPVSLDKFASAYPWTLDIIGEFDDYPTKKCMIGQLLKWIYYLQKKYNNLSCLVIKEPQNSMIPWELLKLGNQPLGVSLQTVRSHSGQDDEDMPLSLDIEGRSEWKCEGRAVVYTTKKVKSNIEQVFPQLQSYSYRSFLHDDPMQTIKHLHESEEQIGLVLLSDIELHKVTKNTQTALLKRAKCWGKSPSLVMLQLAANDDNGCSQRTIAENFLKHGAKGVLAMLEIVDREISQKIMSAFFSEYSRTPNIPIPEILLQLRQKAAEELDERPTDESSVQLYLATSLYAYHGNPMTILQLTSKAL